MITVKTVGTKISKYFLQIKFFRRGTVMNWAKTTANPVQSITGPQDANSSDSGGSVASKVADSSP